MRKKDYSMYEKILMEIKRDNTITEVKLSQKYGVSERTIRRYFKELKDNNKVRLVCKGKERKWEILS